jgi:hypothetical protein
VGWKVNDALVLYQGYAYVEDHGMRDNPNPAAAASRNADSRAAETPHPARRIAIAARSG